MQFRSAIGIVSFALLFLFISLCVGIITTMLVQFKHASVVLYSIQQAHPSIVLDDAGKELFRFSLDRRMPISYDKIPENIKKAFLASEDRQFFNHKGISCKGILRSLLVNIAQGRRAQGASTITQQLCRLLFFESKKTWTRKIKEQIYSFFIEFFYTKEQILEAYLNNVYLGGGIYGIQAACQRFWGKDAACATLAEAALLACIVQSPSRLCPLYAFDRAIERRNVVLGAMKRSGFITSEEYKTAIESIPFLNDDDAYSSYAHLKEYMRLRLERQFGKKNLYSKGYIIQSTINADMQVMAHKVFCSGISTLRKTLDSKIDGGILSLDTSTGAIKAMIGGFSFADSQFNRAMHAKRQMGSTIKPLIYALAEQKGFALTDVEIDEAISLNVGNTIWQPKNYNKKYKGHMTRAYALARSNNMVTIKTLLKLGAQEVVEALKRVEFQGVIEPYPSLALGCVDATLEEIGGMLNIFANQGMFVRPYLMSWIKDATGNKIWHYEPVQKMILDPAIASKVAAVLHHSFQDVYKQKLDAYAISKTGTTNDSRTCFFWGSTAHYSTIVCVGRDDNQSLGSHVFPITTAMPMWMALYKNIALPKKEFILDSRLKKTFVNQWTGKKVQMNDPDGILILERK